MISMPSSQTSQPRPQAPSAGEAQLSSTKRMSCARESMPSGLERLEVELLRVARVRLEDDLELGVRLEAVRVLAVAGVVRAARSARRTPPATARDRAPGRIVAGFIVPAPTSVLKGCTIMQPRSVQNFCSVSRASWTVSVVVSGTRQGYRRRVGAFHTTDTVCRSAPSRRPPRPAPPALPCHNTPAHRLLPLSAAGPGSGQAGVRVRRVGRRTPRGTGALGRAGDHR